MNNDACPFLPARPIAVRNLHPHASDNDDPAAASPFRSHLPSTTNLPIIITAHPPMSFYEETDDEEFLSEELPPLKLDFDAFRRQVLESPVARKVTSWKRTSRGRAHEIFIVYGEDGVPPEGYVARFSRYVEEPAKLRSEAATMQYVRTHTTIPVPDILAISENPANGVGAQFVLMGRAPGAPLDTLWPALSDDHKRAALRQIASVLAQLATLRFDKIGSLCDDGAVGPLIYARGQRGTDRVEAHAMGPSPTRSAGSRRT